MDEIKCIFCLKNFSKPSNLKMHVKNFHPYKFSTLYPTKINNYECKMCRKKFFYLKNLTFHKKAHHQDALKNSHPHSILKLKCPLCKQEIDKIVDHFRSHDIMIETEKFYFSSEEEFMTWKFSIEKINKLSFVKNRGSRVIQKTNSIKSVYNCHRSGTYIGKGKGLRLMKTQNSCKIDGFCPAKIEVVNNSGIFLVWYTKTHVGHDNNFLLNKGKLCSKLKELRKRHTISTHLNLDLVVVKKFGWEVLSSTTEDVYLVKEANRQCICKLVCSECEACLHHFSCTCIDSAIKWNMCKHIHLVCQYQKSLTMKTEMPEEAQETISNDLQNYEIVENSQNLSSPKMFKNLEDQKRQYIDSVLKNLQSINSIKELEMCKKLTAQIEITLAAIRSQSHI